jgi:lipid A oxidase
MRAILPVVLLLVTSVNSARAECIVAAALGAAHTRDADLHLRSDDRVPPGAIVPASFAGRSAESPPYYGLRVECGPGDRWWGGGVDFVHAKAYATLPAGASLEAFAMSHGLNFLTGSLVARWRGAGRRPRAVAGVVRAGAGITLPHVESTVRGAVREGYELGGPAVIAGAGLELRLGPRLIVPVEYRWSWTRVDVSAATGTLTASLYSHHLSAGLGWRIGT